MVLDPPGAITPPPLGLSSHRLDQPSLGDRVVVDYTLDRGSTDNPVSGDNIDFPLTEFKVGLVTPCRNKKARKPAKN